MNIDIKISNTSVKAYLIPGTLSWQDSVNARSTLSFTLKAPQGTLTLAAGLPVLLVNDTAEENIFGGTIDSVAEARITGLKGWVSYQVTCADNHQILDRLVVAESYVDKSISFIINDIVDTYLDDDGVTVGLIEGGDIVVKEAVFDYVPATKVFERLAERTGFNWYLNADKELYFVERTKETAPWSLTEIEDVAGVVVTSHRQNYRNKQIITGSSAETTTQTENFVGDGQQKSFTVGYRMSQEPTVTVGGVAKTVGIRGVDEGTDFFWNKGDKTITAETAPASSAAIQVQYVGEFDVMMIATDTEEVTARAAIEGGSGRYESVETKRGLNTLAGLSEVALDRLRRYADMGRTVTFVTFKEGLEAGQIIPVELDEHGLDTDLLISSITLVEVGKPNQFQYAVTAVTGEAVGGWTQFFKDWVGIERAVTLVNANEIDTVTIVQAFSKDWIESAEPRPFYHVAPATTLAPAATLWPSFHPLQFARYVAWYSDESTEVGRKQITSQSEGAAAITSTTLIFREEGNITISHIGFFGGSLATAATGTGVLTSQHAYSHEKTNLELLQVNMTNNKWS